MLSPHMMTAEVVNLTDHDVVLLAGDEQIVYPSQGNARVAFSSKMRDRLLVVSESGKNYGVPIEDVELGEVTGLPAPQDGVMYIVSQLVVSAVHGRTDLMAPKQVQREDGRVIGCRSFGRSQQ